MKTLTSGLALTLIATALSACNDSQAKVEEKPTPKPVIVEMAAYEQSAVSRSFAATIKPRTEAGVGFRIAGKVIQRLVDNGQTVTKGTVLATLDGADLTLQLNQAEAELRAAVSAQKQSESELQRNLILKKSGVVAAAAVERVTAQADEARSRTDRARQAVELLKNSAEYTSLRSDGDGVVTLTAVEPGSVVSPGQIAFRIARTDEREAEVTIPETLLDKARKDQASITLWSGDGQNYPAKLRELSPMADPVTRTYTARYSLTDLPASASLGMSSTLTLREQQPEKLIKMPLSALRNAGAGSTVWIVDAAAGHVKSSSVEVARVDGASVFIRKGIAPGDQVVTVGVHKLDANLPIRVISNFNY
jgi:RND family efflux transporter MFP subunit